LKNEPHFEKQSSLKISINAGIEISSNSVLENVCFSIRGNFDPDSIIIDESKSHSTDRGRTTDLRLVFDNTRPSILFKIDRFSNARNINSV
jgi:hypothetical protein